jgi:hypothetical protein
MKEETLKLKILFDEFSNPFNSSNLFHKSINKIHGIFYINIKIIDKYVY